MSMSSDKDPAISSMHGMGAQMVLERNLGAQPIDTEDEDTQDNFPHHHGSPQSSSRDRTKDEEAEDDEGEEAEGASASLLHQDVDPEKVLEQNGINISSTDNASDAPGGDAAVAARSDAKVTPSDVSSSQLALEIDSLGPFPMDQGTTSAGGVPVTSAMPPEDTTRTRLPSFSSIIGGSPKPVVEAVASTATQGHIGDQQMTSVLSAADNMQLASASTDLALHEATTGMLNEHTTEIHKCISLHLVVTQMITWHHAGAPSTLT